jgi:hypothetical protein
MPESYIGPVVQNEINEVMGSTPAWMLRCGALLLALTILLLFSLSVVIQSPDVMEGRVEIQAAGNRHTVTATLPVYGSGKIKAGQPVYVIMDKYPREEFGELPGTVVATPVQGAGLEATVSIALNSGFKSTNGHILDPGARASGRCTIVVGKASMMGRLLPFKKQH